VQVTAAPATQTPAWHVSPVVQALPSSHGVVSPLLVAPQTPALQVATWHGPGVGQSEGWPQLTVPATQVPPEQWLPAAQSVLEAQMVLQAVPALLQV
jgi:hypothetical protein